MKNKVAKDDILLRLNLSRASVYKGEPLRASLTLYTRVGIAGFENVKLPSFNGFWSQELPTDNYTTNRQTLDGKVYDTRIIKEYLLSGSEQALASVEREGKALWCGEEENRRLRCSAFLPEWRESRFMSPGKGLRH